MGGDSEALREQMEIQKTSKRINDYLNFLDAQERKEKLKKKKRLNAKKSRKRNW